ncbi:hypothetical protein SARC_11180 [Sphaeroforma arctica JP610]|uniref:SAM-dependent MTase RsmB/NOP-type domain-containing protein n=1 Tax=Sphaeroforma arctica JP610 TaxID=667725 RepID=A0A0L0FIK0_9EUKA|nr:hypothetical protein SARC_11180 [Sphaeroforma arctica JP610]KNC76311.1 hypothetical protein SARC_11180 [Sphaeroforma arctica JP610]|eukprot:XP_014150213.1 hypothetical protein SARC_11180 [Sphaeroforma arctica JP610]
MNFKNNDANSMLYTLAAKVLKQASKKEGTVKSLCLQNGSDSKMKKNLYALVCESLKYSDAIREIAHMSGFPKKEPQIGEWQGIVIIYDHLFGKKGLRCGGVYKQAIVRQKSALNTSLTKLKVKRRIKDNVELIPESVRIADLMPRYVRVNLIRMSVEEAMQTFQTEGFMLVSSETNPAELRSRQFYRDPHIDDVLAFAPKTDFHAHTLYLNGTIIQQDKASCMPAKALNPPPGSTVIDGCAAPGNKTSHLASIMGNKGTIFAFDKDARRLKTLVKLTGLAGASCIKARHQSFLDVDPLDPTYADVEYILLDPSCSGSGIVSRLDQLIDNDDDTMSQDYQERLDNLRQFQETVLLHAFTFPRVKRVSYSTCSIHEQENEVVVANVLAANENFRLNTALPQWPRRGCPGLITGRERGAECVVRVLQEMDFTNGFFVAVFERKPAGRIEDGYETGSTKGQGTNIGVGRSSGGSESAYTNEHGFVKQEETVEAQTDNGATAVSITKNAKKNLKRKINRKRKKAAAQPTDTV